MNVLWIAALSVFVLLEKTLPPGRLFSGPQARRLSERAYGFSPREAGVGTCSLRHGPEQSALMPGSYPGLPGLCVAPSGMLTHGSFSAVQMCIAGASHAASSKVPALMKAISP